VAQGTLFDDLVAVKALKPQWASNEEYVKRFLQDAKAMASSPSPTLIKNPAPTLIL
jgi:hypothetical protein